MTSPPPVAPRTTDPAARAAVALERAERRREALEYLADWGMSLSKDICTRSIDSPYHPELKHDPGRSFASASRAVRLTLAMEERVETYILALCNGVAPAPPPAARTDDPAARSRDDALEPPRDPIEREIGDTDLPAESREREWEQLVEREDFEAVLAEDFDVGVAAIRRDLDLCSSSLPRGEQDRPRSSGPRAAESPAAPPAPDRQRHEPDAIGRSAGFRPALLL